ncbi:MAG: glycosyl transferase, partial [Alphaproteobacteria bacterium]
MTAAAQMIAAATVGIVVWAGCGLAHAMLVRWQVLDRPGQRSSHTRPTPRGGGWAVLAGLLPAWLWVAMTSDSIVFAGLGWLLLAAVFVALVSWRDDLRDVPVGLRLAAQVVAVAVGVWTLSPAPVFQGLLPPLPDAIAAGLVWLWFVNLYNFMDGIDAITAVETMAIGLGVAALALAVAVAGESMSLRLPEDAAVLAGPGLLLAAAAGGVVLWNWPPARVFL